VTFFVALRVAKPRPTSDAHATRITPIDKESRMPMFEKAVVMSAVDDAMEYISLIFTCK